MTSYHYYITTCQVLVCCHYPGLYDRLYPAGWCLVEDMEAQHRHTWTSLASSLSGEDSGYTALTQILIMLQVNQHTAQHCYALPEYAMIL